MTTYIDNKSHLCKNIDVTKCTKKELSGKTNKYNLKKGVNRGVNLKKCQVSALKQCVKYQRSI